MDRFIEITYEVEKDLDSDLKSNMDRFIVVPISSIRTKQSRFKIQYG